MSSHKTEKHILEALDKKGALLAALIDPLDYPSLDDAAKAGKVASASGADYILVGGSIGVQGELLDQVCKEIKAHTHLPLVLFPGNVTTLSRYCDAVYFMSLMNSRNPYWISGAQVLAAPTVRQLGIEALSMGYIVCEPGGTVGVVGDANLIPRSKPAIAAAYAMAGQAMGKHFILTDSGSNPKDGPIPAEFARAVASSISVPYVIGGGVRTPEQATALVKAGADIIQVGTALEKDSSVSKTVAALADAIHAAGKGRKKKFDL